MFICGTIQQWTDLILYSIFVLTLFTATGLVSVKLTNYYMQEQHKRKKFNQLRKNYHCKEKNYYKKVA